MQDKPGSNFQPKRPIVFLLDYIYKELASFKNDLIPEFYLRTNKQRKNKGKIKNPERILGYWDFNQRLAKIGDFISFLEVLNILREDFRIIKKEKNIDICFISDPEHYNSSQKRYFKSYWFKKILINLPIICPNLGSIFVFKSNEEFNQFYLKNKPDYVRWPPTVAGTVPSNNLYIADFFKRKKSIPILDIPDEIKEKIYSFYKKKIYPALPIIVNIRNNHTWDVNRSSNIKEMKKFFKFFSKNKTFKFIIICLKDEIPPDFRPLSNVIFSKDYFNEIEEDLALINTSYLSIFPSSGMACFAWYSKVPFIQHGPHGEDKYTRPKKGGYSFFTKYQRHFEQKVEANWLRSKFNELVNDLKRDKVNNTQLRDKT